MGSEQRYFAASAWLNGRWESGVLLSCQEGRWTQVVPNASAQQAQGATRIDAPVLPGLVDAHSHAFQRAMAGLTERTKEGNDTFWRWRDRMYEAALRVTPAQCESIAAFLYAELLRAGYTQVCEFHYLHNAGDGKPYAQPAEMALALARAAQRVGIGLTLLPTLYMRSGFGARSLRDDQRRFASTPESVLGIAQAVREQKIPNVGAGVALHSLRAVDEAAVGDVAGAIDAQTPLHIHVAEQRQEVADCLERHGQRPVEWLLANAKLDARWNLVHATQTTPDELQALRATGAAVVLCPSTEGNLGDGVFDLPTWMGASGRWSIGSDSHITRSWQEELRLLEYSQRFQLRERNVAARAAVSESTAAALFDGALEGGSAAAGVPLGGLAAGQRADFVVVDTASPALAGIPADHLLDAIVFSSPDARFGRVFVAGREVHVPDVSREFAQAMRELWS